jgi:hypothetical protein
MVTYNDYPLALCAEQVAPLIAKGIKVYQKFTCAHCGSRQTMGDANVFFLSGRCEECQKVTKITHCNYMVHAEGADQQQALWKAFGRGD